MTGLEAGKDKIIEVAAIITDKELVPFDEGFERIIHCDEDIMNGMDEWCTEHHRDVPSLSLSLPFVFCLPFFCALYRSQVILIIMTLPPRSPLIIPLLYFILYLLSRLCSPF